MTREAVQNRAEEWSELLKWQEKQLWWEREPKLTTGDTDSHVVQVPRHLAIPCARVVDSLGARPTK